MLYIGLICRCSYNPHSCSSSKWCPVRNRISRMSLLILLLSRIFLICRSLVSYPFGFYPDRRVPTCRPPQRPLPSAAGQKLHSHPSRYAPPGLSHLQLGAAPPAAPVCGLIVGGGPVWSISRSVATAGRIAGPVLDGPGADPDPSRTTKRRPQVPSCPRLVWPLIRTL